MFEKVQKYISSFFYSTPKPENWILSKLSSILPASLYATIESFVNLLPYFDKNTCSHPGDFLCEANEDLYHAFKFPFEYRIHLPKAFADLSQSIQEQNPLPYPFGKILAAGIVLPLCWKKYKTLYADIAQQLTLLIKTNFGEIAEDINQLIEQSIEDSTTEFTDKYKTQLAGLSEKQLEKIKKERRKEIIEKEVLPFLKEKENRDKLKRMHSVYKEAPKQYRGCQDCVGQNESFRITAKHILQVMDADYRKKVPQTSALR